MIAAREAAATCHYHWLAGAGLADRPGRLADGWRTAVSCDDRYLTGLGGEPQSYTPAANDTAAPRVCRRLGRMVIWPRGGSQAGSSSGTGLALSLPRCTCRRRSAPWLFAGGMATVLLTSIAMYALALHSPAPDREDLYGITARPDSFVSTSATADSMMARSAVPSGGEGQQPGVQRKSVPPLPPQVQIDESGVFKYVLLEMAGTGDGDDALLVRGRRMFNFHRDNVKEAANELEQFGLPRPRVLGGGRLRVTPPAGSGGGGGGHIEVFGYSKTYGRCDSCNARAAKLLRIAFPGYEVVWSNDGY